MAAGTAAPSLLPPVKSVVVYKNGDPYYTGRRFVVNQRQVSTMEAFLTEVTQCIGAQLAVRNLYTPRQGHKVSDLQELRTGAQYVAAGFEKFKKLDYMNAGVKKQNVPREESQTEPQEDVSVRRSETSSTQPTQSRRILQLEPSAGVILFYFEHFIQKCYIYAPGLCFTPIWFPDVAKTKVSQRLNVSAKWRKFIPVPCIIHVFRNGDLLCAPFRFIIPRHMQQDLEQVLSLVTEKVSLRTGAVRRLCSLEGAPVSSASELETGHSYVAVGTERFKKLPYEELLVSKAAERNFPGKRRMLRRNENRKGVNGAEDQLSDSALLTSPESDGRRVKSTGDEASSQQASLQRVALGDPAVFLSKPVKVRKNRGYLPNGAVRHSVFKRAGRRRREEVRGAEEVPEDENTATELPIDQTAAETVDDEELNAAEHSDGGVQGVSSGTYSTQVTSAEAENIRGSTKHPNLNHYVPEESATKSEKEELKHHTEDIVTNGVVVST